MTFCVVVEVALDYGYSIEAATQMARTVSDADFAADRVFSSPKKLKCLPNYLINRSHHLNMSGLIWPSTQEIWAREYKRRAIDTGNLVYLGYGLHSQQDLVAHGRFPIWGSHLRQPFTGYNPDQDLSVGRIGRAYRETERYVRDYFIATAK